MDIIYILGTGSKWHDNELRYSLRSVERYCPYRRIFVFGERPAWLENVQHVKMFDKHNVKTQNGVAKIIAAAKHPDTTEDFILMNDDFYFLRPLDKIPYYFRGTIEEMLARHKTKSGYYFKMLQDTNNKLKQMGIKQPVDYEVHYPVVFNKQKLLQVANMVGTGYDLLGIRSLYGNLMQVGGQHAVDFKVQNITEFAYQRRRDPGCISSSDTVVMAQEFRDFIMQKFDFISMFENDLGSGTRKQPGNRVRKRYYFKDQFTHGGTVYQAGAIVPPELVPQLVNNNHVSEHVEHK